MSNNFVLDPSIDDFASEEGFARITRDGKSDIYVVQNQEYPGNYKVSLAFVLDDFEPSDPTKTYGEPLVINALDRVEYLGSAVDYFVPKAPLWEVSLEVVRMVTEKVGLLPIVRAIEYLREKGKKPNVHDLTKTVDYYVADYHNRRSQLIA
jgi:hypothetical protein